MSFNKASKDFDFNIGTGIIKYINKAVAPLGKLYLVALKEQVDLEAQKLFDDIKAGCPRGDGDADGRLRLAESLTIEKKDDNFGYGYFIDFPNKKLDNSKVYNGKRHVYRSTITYHDLAYLNEIGDMKHEGKHFIKKAIRKLKGLDARINNRFEKMAAKLEKE